jgi:hypothetical protein
MDRNNMDDLKFDTMEELLCMYAALKAGTSISNHIKLKESFRRSIKLLPISESQNLVGTVAKTLWEDLHAS